MCKTGTTLRPLPWSWPAPPIASSTSKQRTQAMTGSRKGNLPSIRLTPRCAQDLDPTGASGNETMSVCFRQSASLTLLVSYDSAT